MPIFQTIGWSIGDARLYELEPLSKDGKALSDPTKRPYDVSTWSFAWVMRTDEATADPPLLEKRTSTGGIAIVGVYDPNRTLNTQRVLVTILDSDTDALAEGVYVHALKRMDTGLEATLVKGNVILTKTAAPAS